MAAVRRARAAKARYACGVGFVTCNIGFCQVVETGDIPRLFRRDREYLLERADFILRHDAVSLRHFRRERDHGDRKGDTAAQFRIACEYRADSPPRYQ